MTAFVLFIVGVLFLLLPYLNTFEIYWLAARVEEERLTHRA